MWDQALLKGNCVPPIEPPRVLWRLSTKPGVVHVVARTAMSKSWRGTTAISSNLVGEIKKQLHLPRSSDLVDLVSCTLSRDEYLKLFV